MPLKHTASGFTLMEVLVVLAIIAILAVMAMPRVENPIARKQVAESMELIEDYKKVEAAIYKTSFAFPKDNVAAGIPKPELILGNYVDSVEVQDGAFHIYFGKKANPILHDKILTVRPIVVIASAESPISWICGYSSVPEGMAAKGQNKTNIDKEYLPISCRQ